MEIKDQRVRGVLEDLALIAEKTYRLIEEIAYETGYYRKRAADVIVGDEINWGDGQWRLVTDISIRRATFPNAGFDVVHLDFETGPPAGFDPEDFLDVKTQPDEVDPETGKPLAQDAF